MITSRKNTALYLKFLLRMGFSALNVDTYGFCSLNRTQIGRKRSLRSD